MATFNKFNAFTLNLGKGTMNLLTDTLKVMLTNTLPTAANNVTSDITQISNGNGYTTGGATSTQVSFTQSSGTAKLIIGNVTFTATGSVGPFEYAVLVDTTVSGGQLIGWWDYGSAVTLASGDTFTVSFDQTNGVLTLA